MSTFVKGALRIHRKNVSLSLTRRGDSERNSAMLTPPITERTTMLRLLRPELARLAGINVKTVTALLNGWHRRGPRDVVAHKVERAVTAEELRLRDYLCAIHGPPQGE